MDKLILFITVLDFMLLAYIWYGAKITVTWRGYEVVKPAWKWLP